MTRTHLQALTIALIAITLGGKNVASTESKPTLKPLTGGGDRIVNGVHTSKFAASGALLVETKNGPTANCSGTLIRSNAFLTAAHCIEHKPDPSRYKVFFQSAGIFDVAKVFWPKGKYKWHASNGSIGDIAILQLDRCVEGILPQGMRLKRGNLIGTEVRIIGFGQTRGNVYDSGIKRFGRTKLAKCPTNLNSNELSCWQFGYRIDQNQSESNTCNVDSGGAVISKTDDLILAVTSGGNRTCLADHAFSTNIASNSEWIEKTLTYIPEGETCEQSPNLNESKDIFGELLNFGPGFDRYSRTLLVPEKVEVIRIAINGENDRINQNDFDLYFYNDETSTATTGPCIENSIGQFHFCEITQPSPGQWTIEVRRKSGTGFAQLTISRIMQNQN